MLYYWTVSPYVAGPDAGRAIATSREEREGDYAAQQPNFAASRPSREMVLHGQY